MKILFVGKRRPQQRDLLDRPYGRFHHLPAGLAALGHQVTVALVGHQGLAAERREQAGVQWLACDIRSQGWRHVSAQLRQEARQLSPDWVVGCSDAWYGWLAHRLALRCDARLAIDAYDNYEAYMPWNLPLHWLWRRAIAAADLVTAAGPQLADKLLQSRPGRRVEILPMAADPGFLPMDRSQCRDQFGLDQSRPLFGYSGAWTRSRGSELLLDAFQRVRRELPDAGLLLTGRPPPRALAVAGVISLGYLPDGQMPAAVNAADVTCVIVADTAFGRYSYPAKLCEAIACGRPALASETAATRWMLAGAEKHLAPCGDAQAHAAKMIDLYTNPAQAYPQARHWQELSADYAALLARG